VTFIIHTCSRKPSLGQTNSQLCFNDARASAINENTPKKEEEKNNT